MFHTSDRVSNVMLGEFAPLNAELLSRLKGGRKQVHTRTGSRWRWLGTTDSFVQTVDLAV